MHAHTPRQRRAALAVAVLVSFFISSGADASPGTQVPDLMVLPAQISARAVHSLQLALASAGKRLVSVGERGTILLSDDAGKSWRQARKVPVSVTLTDVFFSSADRGWAVGHSGVILATVDGGETWTRQVDGVQVAAIIRDDAQSRVNAGEVGAEAALKNAQYLVSDGPDKPFLSVRFADDQRGYAVGAYGIALKTEDGGKTWHSMVASLPNPRGRHLYQVQISGNELLVAGEQGTLLHSINGGESFMELATPYSGTFIGALIPREGELLAYGLRGNVWLSSDAGSSWQHLDLGQPITFVSGKQLRSGALVLADESGRLLRSTDGGKHFDVLATESSSSVTSIAEASDGALIVSGARGVQRLEPEALTAVQVQPRRVQ